MSEVEGETHSVCQGESTTSLSFERGLYWKTVWQHANNASLRSKRSNPNILLEGDEIFLPFLQQKDESCATGQKHRFQRKGVPETLNLTFLDMYGKPLKDKPYKLTIDGDFRKGTLDANGKLSEPIPPNARSAKVEVGDKGELATTEVFLGHLDPVETLTGVQARLKNLGYFGAAIDGEPSDLLDKAVVRFRRKNGMEEGKEINDDLRNKLKDLHGG
ncbi:MAG: peptidoglycan-binding domain-containing protein [Phycisphaerales bacterium]|jgi:hypothetical protein